MMHYHIGTSDGASQIAAVAVATEFTNEIVTLQ
jgi:hypothetical protein